MYKFNCEKCGRVFEGNKEWDVRFTRDEHQEYCKLPVKHKILQIVLFPMGILAFGLMLTAGIVYLTFAPLAYPFVYAMKLLLDNEVITWDSYKDKVYGEDRVKSRMPGTKEKRP